MRLRKQLIRMGIGDYITIPKEAQSRRVLNALIYSYLLNNFTLETNIRSVCLQDGSAKEWLDGMERELLPFLRRLAKCRAST